MKVTYNKQLTALLAIDPYNDFISEGGKLWDRLKGVADDCASRNSLAHSNIYSKLHHRKEFSHASRPH